MSDTKTKFELAESQEALDLVPAWELEWWWIAAALGVVILIVILGWVFLRRRTISDPNKAKREAFQEALAELAKLDASMGKENVIKVSLVMRKYLAKSMNEPALYETHEEFIGRHDAIKDLDEELKATISLYFSEMAALKYGLVEECSFDVADLKSRATDILERIHAS